PVKITAPVTHDSDCLMAESVDRWEGHCTFIASDVGFGIVRPYVKNNPAFFVSTTGNPAVARQLEFSPANQLVPALSVSLITGTDWGIRASWWGFATSDVELVNNPGQVISAAPLGLALLSDLPGDKFIAWSKLSMNVADIEATHDYRGCNWAIRVAG